MRWLLSEPASDEMVAMGLVSLSGLSVLYNVMLWTIRFDARLSHRIALALLSFLGAQYGVWIFATTALLAIDEHQLTMAQVWAEPLLCAAMCVLLAISHKFGLVRSFETFGHRALSGSNTAARRRWRS